MMGESIKNVFIFAAGVAVGAGLTYKLVKTKYEQIANDEIAEMKAYYNNKYGDFLNYMNEPVGEEVKAEVVKVEEKPNITEYASLIKNKGYSEKEDEVPYVISPDDFGENEDYEHIYLTYYANGFLVDDDDNVIEDVEAMIGDAIDRIGEYEENVIHVCDDKREFYYEIVADPNDYFIEEQEEE